MTSTWPLSAPDPWPIHHGLLQDALALMPQHAALRTEVGLHQLPRSTAHLPAELRELLSREALLQSHAGLDGIQLRLELLPRWSRPV